MASVKPQKDLKDSDDDKKKKWPLTHDQLHHIQRMFKFFREWHTHKITWESLQQIFSDIGIQVSHQRCARIISQHSDTGAMSFEDFLIFYAQSFTKYSSEEEMKEVFRLLDDDGDGYVPVPRLKVVFAALKPHSSNQEISQIIGIVKPKNQSFREFDLKGKIDFKQFMRLMVS